MSNSIQDARAAVIEERERIQTEIRDLEAKLVELDSAVVSLDRLLDVQSSNGRTPSRGGRGRPAASNAVASNRRGRREHPSMVSLIEAFVESQGRSAAHATEVLDYLESISRSPGGKNPKATVQTTLGQLQKRGRVKNVGGNRWQIERSGRSASSGSSDGDASSE